MRATWKSCASSPTRPPAIPGYDIAGLSLPAYEIGGDYFDYIPLAGGKLGVALADVAGKGIPAALVMTAFRALLLFRAGGQFESLGQGGSALGVFRVARCASGVVALASGDLLVLHTDGVVELENQDRQEYGVRRLAEAVRRSVRRPAADIVQSVVQSTRDFSGFETYDDDFTLIVLRRQCPVSQYHGGLAHGQQSNIPQRLDRSVRGSAGVERLFVPGNGRDPPSTTRQGRAWISSRPGWWPR